MRQAFRGASQRAFCAILTAVAALALAGCGGGGGDTDAPAITILPDSITTNPSVLSFTGGSATFKVKVDDPAGVNPSTVKIDVVDANGASVIGGPQVMTLVAGQTDIYTYSTTFPNNVAGTQPNVYSARVSASDLKGNSSINPTVIGQVAVPNPPAPPPAP